MTTKFDAFRQWLTDELYERNWSQTELARRSNLDRTYISRVLSGDRNPGLDFYRRIARALRLPVTTVLAAAGEIPAPEDLGQPHILALTQALAQLPPSARHNALEAIFTIIDTFSHTPNASVLLIAPQPLTDQPAATSAAPQKTPADTPADQMQQGPQNRDQLYFFVDSLSDEDRKNLFFMLLRSLAPELADALPDRNPAT